MASGARKAVPVETLRAALRAATLVYIALPVALFLLGWLRPLAAAVAVAALAFGVVRSRDASGAGADPGTVSSWAPLLALLPLLPLLALSGVGGVGAESEDWSKHYAVLVDLVRQPWPVAYRTEAGPVALVYYVAWYLPAAAVGAWGGWELANAALFVWTGIGLALLAGWLVVLTRVHPLLAGLVFAFFGGADIWANLLEDGLRNTLQEALQGDYFRWQHAFWYEGTEAQLFWAPGQALGGWLLGALTLDAIRRRDARFPAAWVLGMAPLWSPFAALGLVPFALLPLLLARESLAERVRAQLGALNLTGLALGGVVVAYLATRWGSYALPPEYTRGFRDLPNGLAGALAAGQVGLFLHRWSLFCLTEFLGIALPLLFVYRWRDRDGRISPALAALAVAVGVLLLLPWFRYGRFNDLVMRASLPALFVLAVLAIEALGRVRRHPLAVAALAGVLALGAIHSLSGIARRYHATRARGEWIRVPPASEHPDLFALHLRQVRGRPGRAFGMIQQYLGSLDAPFFRLLGATPRPRPIPPQPGPAGGAPARRGSAGEAPQLREGAGPDPGEVQQAQ